MGGMTKKANQTWMSMAKRSTTLTVPDLGHFFCPERVKRKKKGFDKIAQLGICIPPTVHRHDKWRNKPLSRRLCHKEWALIEAASYLEYLQSDICGNSAQKKRGAGGKYKIIKDKKDQLSVSQRHPSPSLKNKETQIWRRRIKHFFSFRERGPRQNIHDCQKTKGKKQKHQSTVEAITTTSIIAPCRD